MKTDPQHDYPTCYELCNHCTVCGVGIRYGSLCPDHGNIHGHAWDETCGTCVFGEPWREHEWSSSIREEDEKP